MNFAHRLFCFLAFDSGYISLSGPLAKQEWEDANPIQTAYAYKKAKDTEAAFNAGIYKNNLPLTTISYLLYATVWKGIF